MVSNVQRRSIVVPWNFDGPSRVALDQALVFADGVASVRAVHVMAPFSDSDSGILYGVEEKSCSEELEQRFWKQIGDIRATGRISFHVEFGRTVHEIAKFADRYSAEMVVVASTRKPGIMRFLFGDLADNVVRASDCPVYVIQGTKLNYGLKKGSQDTQHLAVAQTQPATCCEQN